MENHILTRMGDGERLRLSDADMRADIDDGTEDAAKRAGIPELTDEERKQLFDIMADPSRIVSVQPGEAALDQPAAHHRHGLFVYTRPCPFLPSRVLGL